MSDCQSTTNQNYCHNVTKIWNPSINPTSSNVMLTNSTLKIICKLDTVTDEGSILASCSAFQRLQIWSRYSGYLSIQIHSNCWILLIYCCHYCTIDFVSSFCCKPVGTIVIFTVYLLSLLYCIFNVISVLYIWCQQCAVYSVSPFVLRNQCYHCTVCYSLKQRCPSVQLIHLTDCQWGPQGDLNSLTGN